jgi:hypothetical protein
MRQDFSWRHSAREYVKLYEKAVALNQPATVVPPDSFPRGRFRSVGAP